MMRTYTGREPRHRRRKQLRNGLTIHIAYQYVQHVECTEKDAGQGKVPHLAHAQVVAVRVCEELRQVVELGDELLDVTAAAQAVAPGGGHAAEQPVRMVKAPALRDRVRFCWMSAAR